MVLSCVEITISDTFILPKWKDLTEMINLRLLIKEKIASLYKKHTCGWFFLGFGGTAGPIFLPELFTEFDWRSTLFIKANSANCLSKSFILNYLRNGTEMRNIIYNAI